MAKMTKAQKAWRTELMERLVHVGGKVLFNPESGVTVATMPSVQGKAKFGRAAVAVCSEGDKPKRKMGELIAMQNLFDGISFPVKIENWDNDWQANVNQVLSYHFCN